MIFMSFDFNQFPQKWVDLDKMQVVSSIKEALISHIKLSVVFLLKNVREYEYTINIFQEME